MKKVKREDISLPLSAEIMLDKMLAGMGPVSGSQENKAPDSQKVISYPKILEEL